MGLTVSLLLRVAHVRCLQDPVLLGDDKHQSDHMDDISEHEVADELEKSRRYAHTVCNICSIFDSIKLTRIQAISSDPASEQDELDASELEGKDNSGVEDRNSGRRGDRHKRNVQRPTQAFASPLARFGHYSPQKELPQVCGLVSGLSLFFAHTPTAA